MPTQAQCSFRLGHGAKLLKFAVGVLLARNVATVGAVAVTNFEELAAAVESSDVTDVTINFGEMNFERVLQPPAGKDMSVSGVVQQDGSLPVLRGSNLFNLVGMSMSLANVAVQLPPSSASPTQASPPQQLFAALSDGELQTSNVILSTSVCAGWTLVGSKCISAVSEELATWTDAEAQCVASGAHLVSILDQSFNSLMWQQLHDNSGESAWIGASFDTDMTQQWSDDSDPFGYSWPLSSADETGNCMFLSEKNAGIWSRARCSGSQPEELHHYVCSYNVDPSKVANNLDGVTGSLSPSITHTDMVLRVESINEMMYWLQHVVAGTGPSFSSLQFSSKDELVTVPVPGSFPFQVEVRITGTGLTNEATVVVENAPTGVVPSAIQGNVATFLLDVTSFPKYLYYVGGSAATSVSQVDVLLGGQLIVQQLLSNEVECVIDAVANGFFPYTVANNAIQVKANRALSLDVAAIGCDVFSLWSPPTIVSPLVLQLQGNNLENLQIQFRDGSSIDVPADGTVDLSPVAAAAQIETVVSIVRKSATVSACLEAVSLNFYDDVLGEMTSKSLFDNCPAVCGAMFLETCLAFGNDNLSLDAVTLDFGDKSGEFCNILNVAQVTDTISSSDACTFTGAFDDITFLEVFGESEYSVFRFTSEIPTTVDVPGGSNTVLPTNKVLALNGEYQTGNDTSPIQLGSFVVSGVLELESI